MKKSSSSPHIESMRCGINGTIHSSGLSSMLQSFCPLIIIFLQFSITSMFMWMLCEGIHLNNVLTVSVFKNHFKTYYFYILGWGKNKNKKVVVFFFSYTNVFIVVPFCITLSWSIVMFINERGRK